MLHRKSARALQSELPPSFPLPTTPSCPPFFTAIASSRPLDQTLLCVSLTNCVIPQMLLAGRRQKTTVKTLPPSHRLKHEICNLLAQFSQCPDISSPASSSHASASFLCVPEIWPLEKPYVYQQCPSYFPALLLLCEIQLPGYRAFCSIAVQPMPFHGTQAFFLPL